jgi:hypothetical protein
MKQFPCRLGHALFDFEEIREFQLSPFVNNNPPIRYCHIRSFLGTFNGCNVKENACFIGSGHLFMGAHLWHILLLGLPGRKRVTWFEVS